VAAVPGPAVALGSCLGTRLPTACRVSASPPGRVERFFAWVLLLF